MEEKLLKLEQGLSTCVTQEKLQDFSEKEAVISGELQQVWSKNQLIFVTLCLFELKSSFHLFSVLIVKV